jgi:hypothetical protein
VASLTIILYVIACVVTFCNMINLDFGWISFVIWPSQAIEMVVTWWMGFIFGYVVLNELRLLHLTNRALHHAKEELNLLPLDPKNPDKLQNNKSG